MGRIVAAMTTATAVRPGKAGASGTAICRAMTIRRVRAGRAGGILVGECSRFASLLVVWAGSSCHYYRS